MVCALWRLWGEFYHIQAIIVQNNHKIFDLYFKLLWRCLFLLNKSSCAQELDIIYCISRRWVPSGLAYVHWKALPSQSSSDKQEELGQCWLVDNQVVNLPMWEIRNRDVGFLLLKEQVETKTSHLTGRSHNGRCYWHCEDRAGIRLLSIKSLLSPLWWWCFFPKEALALLEISF